MLRLDEEDRQTLALWSLRAAALVVGMMFVMLAVAISAGMAWRLFEAIAGR